MRLTFTVHFEFSTVPSIMWVGLIHSVEGLHKLRVISPKKEFFQKAEIVPFPWVSSLPAYSADFGLVSLNNHKSQFLKNNLYTHIHTDTDTGLTGSVSLEHPD
jgi:hypothetical protein